MVIRVILILIGILLSIGMIASGETQLNTFLAEDQTNTHEFIQWYTSGHFARDLVRNASQYNLTLGSVILGRHPTFMGYQNHIMNYYVQNGSFILIEPQTDQIIKLNDSMYRYYRLYPDGTQVPTYWRYHLAHTGEI